jgi:hypothetical protein
MRIAGGKDKIGFSCRIRAFPYSLSTDRIVTAGQDVPVETGRIFSWRVGSGQELTFPRLRFGLRSVLASLITNKIVQVKPCTLA